MLLALALIPSAAGALLAQSATGVDGRTLTPRDTSGTHKTLFTYRDAALAAGFVGLTVAMFPLDKRLAAKLQDSATQTNRFLDNGATNVAWITSPGAFYIGGAMYAVGRLSGQRDIADLGWHGTEAVLLASGVTNILKATLGRSRPYVSANQVPKDFQFGGGLSGSSRKSFPSGHTTTAFAAASVVTSEIRRIYPKATWIVGPALYGGAALTGLSRMYHNQHWASDVVLGAAVGTFTGLKVVRYSHGHPGNRLDRFMLAATVMPTASGGAILAFTLPTP